MSPTPEASVDPADELMFLCLGGGNEVGRSCHIVQYKGKTIMLDAGMHPAYDGLAALPFYDEFDLSTVDVLLVSHFHLDHAASLPYVLAKTNFRGRVFMTHPTKAIYKWLIQDSVRVNNTSASASSQPLLYNEADHLSTFSQIEAIDYHTTHTVSSIRITPYPAGHVLGAAMFLIEIAGLKIFFTGDYSREDDRHLLSAEVPKGVKIDVLITESTYGIASHIPRIEREAALMKSITGILNRGGRVLMPVFALGRAQELLLILDEYWGRHSELQKIPIYYASNLARKCMVVYQTYVGAMNNNIKRLFRERMAEAESAGDVSRGGPWDFKHIRSLKNLDRFDDVGSCVMLASPGMMQSGVSRELLERWAPDQKNGVVITGYSVDGTMAKQIMNEPDTIPAIMTRGAAARARGLAGGRGEAEIPQIPLRCTVQELSFAAHVDGVENREFIEEIAAPVVILVHGEQHNMMRLKSKLLSLNSSKTTPTKIFSPRNAEELRIPFAPDRTAKVVGRLAQLPPPTTESEAQTVSGVLVQNDFKMSLMAPEDLREYAGLNTTTILCRQKITLSAAGIALVRWALEGTFGSVDELPQPTSSPPSSKPSSDSSDAMNGSYANGTSLSSPTSSSSSSLPQNTTSLRVLDAVTVHHQPTGSLQVEWEGNAMNDAIADAVMAVLFKCESSPAAVKQSSQQSSHHSHNHNHTPHPPKAPNPHANLTPELRLSRVLMLLETQFGAPNISIIEIPPLPPSTPSNTPEDEKDEIRADELRRLHALGIPVPGLEIRVDKQVALVWFETLEVVSKSRVLADRVRAVMERVAEVVAPLAVGGGIGGMVE
ncbi:MAG: endoribonuclease ysh1 [Vezdaea acicularis]|nr:MAG: endoribonuclease ysh1 [Vezdaea acicularis]